MVGDSLDKVLLLVSSGASGMVEGTKRMFPKGFFVLLLVVVFFVALFVFGCIFGDVEGDWVLLVGF